jgi:hypothetical protein
MATVSQRWEIPLWAQCTGVSHGGLRAKRHFIARSPCSCPTRCGESTPRKNGDDDVSAQSGDPWRPPAASATEVRTGRDAARDTRAIRPGTRAGGPWVGMRSTRADSEEALAEEVDDSGAPHGSGERGLRLFMRARTLR